MQRVAYDFAAQLKLAGGGPKPPAGDFAFAGVVVLDALADGLEVVVGLAVSEFSDREHPSVSVLMLTVTVDGLVVHNWSGERWSRHLGASV